MVTSSVKMIECPRDAMQGWKHFIPTEKKVEYLRALLKTGFDTLDCGSFVSPKAIPQMADTAQVLNALPPDELTSKLLVIVANQRGAEEAVTFDNVSYLGFPFSVSETFQQRNTNSSMQESLSRVEAIQSLCVKHTKELVIYISMGFGNPYGDPFSEEIVFAWMDKIAALGVRTISLADTVGLATADQVYRMTEYAIRHLPQCEIGVHLHSTAMNREEKTAAAVRAGCKRFDGALKGIGGCPMADDELVGNMDTEWMVDYFERNGLQTGLDKAALANSSRLATEIFV